MRPGLIPQKTTRRSVLKTSGTALGCFGLSELLRIARFKALLEAPAQCLAVQPHGVARAPRLEPHHVHTRVPAAVAPGITFGFAERAQPSHGHTLRRTPDGSCTHREGRISRRLRGLRGLRSTFCSRRSSAARFKACASTQTTKAST